MAVDTYERRKQQATKRVLDMSRDARDIAPLPKVKKPKRRASCEKDLRRFCETYFPLTFELAWCQDHVRAIAKIEKSVLEGGLFAMAMPRGSGKSSLTISAAIWAILYGHRKFVVLIGSDEGHAVMMLESIKAELSGNGLLLEDFPEVVYPIHCLDGISHRCKGQLLNGERTNIGWTADRVVMPTVPKSKASGSILRVAGITGGIRGMNAKTPDGRTIRPDFVIPDDPQTDASSRSPSQNVTRERILAGAILGLAGPGKKIAGVMPCTVISEGDMADHILDRQKHPEWQGERTKMLYTFPTNEQLWEKYAEIRAESLKSGHGIVPATEFYRQNREAMDEGAEVAWPERFNHDELSAIQHAMNLFYQDRRAFFAEYQNDPEKEDEVREEELTPERIAGKINRRGRGAVPLGCSRITAAIDVQQNLLFYTVCAWQDDFTGYVIDYGAWPEQRKAYYTLADASPVMSHRDGLEAAIYSGLDALTGKLLTRDWHRDDGSGMRIEKCLIDANWGLSAGPVKSFCRESVHAAVLMPSHGRYFGASSTPLNDFQKRQGDRIGYNWRIPASQIRGVVRHVAYDTNFWKSFVYERLLVGMGGRGCLSLWGDRPDTHRMFADHLTAEYRMEVTARGRTVWEWKIRPERRDNHFLDTLTMATMAASMQGCVLTEAGGSMKREKKRRVNFAEQQRQARMRREA